MSGHSTESGAAVVLDTRRRRTREEKEAILAELKAPGAKVSAIARRYGVGPSLVFRWRRELASRSVRGAAKAEGLMPVVVAADAGTPKGGIIEIELGGGRRVRVDGSFDAAALRRVIAVLEIG
jgi:transposase